MLNTSVACTDIPCTYNENPTRGFQGNEQNITFNK